MGVGRFTNEWRKAFDYGQDYTSLGQDGVWTLAQKVYKDYPVLLEAARKTIFR